MIKKIKITESQFRKLVEIEHLADLGTDYPLDENKKETIGRILREELNKPIRRRINFSNIDGIIKKHRMGSFLKNEPVEKSIDKTILQTMYQVMPRDSEDYDVDYHKAWDEIKTYIRNNYSEELRQYFEKRQKDSDEDKNPLGIKYIFVKHDKPYYDSGWRGFADGFDSFDEMITKYGNWVDVDWDEVKNKLDKINDYPESTFTGAMKSRPLRISNIGDAGNSWGYNFSIIKSIPEENLDKILKEGLHDTSWENDKGDKITLMDLLKATEDIPVEKISVEELKPYLLTWDGDEDERGKIDKADLQYPILIFVDNDGRFISIIDGHHRAQKAVRKGLETIKAKIIPINSLPKNIRRVFGHMGRQEQNEGEITERCWKGYTQKGMKTMFGKRYPNCVKKTK